MTRHYTSGQVAKKLRISISTLKRWLEAPDLSIPELRNYNGWRLFSDGDISTLREYKRSMRRNGKRFKETILIPVHQKPEQRNNQ